VPRLPWGNIYRARVFGRLARWARRGAAGQADRWGVEVSKPEPLVCRSGPRVERDGTVVAMARCEVCGNDYDKSFEVIMAGRPHVFDSFECAIHALAPVCEHCGCKVIGHGVESDGYMYCCAHCAGEEGVRTVSDRADHAGTGQR
jgi:hypothetical protein